MGPEFPGRNGCSDTASDFAGRWRLGALIDADTLPRMKRRYLWYQSSMRLGRNMKNTAPNMHSAAQR